MCILASVLTPVIQEFVQFNSRVSVTIMTQLPIPYSLLFFPQNFYWKFLYLLNSISSFISFNSLCCVLSIISLNISFKNYSSLYLLPDLLLNSFSFYINDYNFHLEKDLIWWFRSKHSFLYWCVLSTISYYDSYFKQNYF